jgi:hypothetical protein
MFSQYAYTYGGIACATGYTLYTKNKKGIVLLAAAGMGGTIADMGAGFFVNCRDQRELADKFKQMQQQE